MNPPSSRPGSSSQQPHGCQGNGCANRIDTWQLHHVYRGGESSRLCCSCILLSHRSYYCCSCCFLIPRPALWSSSSSHNDEWDKFVAQPVPITICRVCRNAVAHLACLHPSNNGGAIVCPACAAAADGMLYSYAPPTWAPLSERGARVLAIASWVALVQLRQSADMARAEAELLAQNAAASRSAARSAIAVAMNEESEVPFQNINVQLKPVASPPPRSWNGRRLERGEGSAMESAVNVPPRSTNSRRLERGEGSGMASAVNATPAPARSSNSRHLERGEGSGMASAVNAPPPRQARQKLRRSMGKGKKKVRSRNQPKPMAVLALPRSGNRRRLERGEGSGMASAPPLPQVHQQLRRREMPMPPLSGLTIGGSERVTQLAMAATAAARDSLPPRSPLQTLPLFGVMEQATAAVAEASPPTLQLFPTEAGCSSSSTPRTLQLFQDEVPDDEEM